jgi:N-methylhydantoinase B/oxoprolinase/acetone carboxylase alpha subunit
MSTKIIGCDVGGTFTDLILLDEQSGALRIAKVPTTTHNQAEGVLAPGDRIVVHTPGGGGFGAPRERDTALVERDVKRGYYSPVEAARRFDRALSE